MCRTPECVRDAIERLRKLLLRRVIGVEWNRGVLHPRRDFVNPQFCQLLNRRLACSARVLLCVLGVSLSNPASLAAEDANPSADHTAKAMALLRANCLSCHDTEKEKGGLVLSTRDAALKGGDNGPALAPGKAAESLLVKVLAADADPHMPPKKQLLDRQIATLRAWVDAGAAWDEKVLNATTDLAIPADFGPLPTAYQPVLAVALSPDEKTLALGRGGRIYVHDVSQTERPLVKELDAHRDAVQSLAWSGDGKQLVSGGFRQAMVWDAAQWELARALTNDLRGRVTALAFTPDHGTLIVADSVAADSGWVRVFNLGDGAQSTAWQAHGDSIFALDLSADGKLLATAGADRLGRLWEFASRKELGRLERHEGHLLAIAFNPDASWVATGATDKLLKIWDAKTLQEIISDTGPGAAVTGLRWAGDGKSLVTVGEDGTPRVFNEFKPHTGAANSAGAKDRKLGGVGEMLNAVAMTKDGQTIYAGAQDGVVHIWSGDGKLQGKLTAPGTELAKQEKAAE
jgi:mono/diheme cytochrome c family protein